MDVAAAAAGSCHDAGDAEGEVPRKGVEDRQSALKNMDFMVKTTVKTMVSSFHFLRSNPMITSIFDCGVLVFPPFLFRRQLCSCAKPRLP